MEEKDRGTNNVLIVQGQHVGHNIDRTRRHKINIERKLTILSA